ncbi:MAG: S8 family peptidase [Thermoplasmatota archaeon]
MSRGRLIPFAVAALFFAPLLVTHSGGASSVPVRIAVLDTGIDATHPEFAPGQIVAWKDFVNARATPYDDNGHGTGTASLIAGADLGACGSTPKKSFAPGAPLIVGKIGDASGSASFQAIHDAIEWAISQGASVISISFGASVPIPLGFDAAFVDARNAGVLVVVAAGNGLLNFGLVPYPAWESDLGTEPGVIAVGGGSRTGNTITSLTGNDDPDVTSWSDSVCIAKANTAGYVIESGTSFATPLVAGMAGHAKQVAIDNGRNPDYATMKHLVLFSGTNTVTSPYAREGMGFLLDTENARMDANAAAGTLPNYDAQGEWAVIDHDYHDDVIETYRG